MVLKARLPTKKKLGLVAMFTGGLFATTAGFLRCVLIITVQSFKCFESFQVLVLIYSIVWTERGAASRFMVVS